MRRIAHALALVTTLALMTAACASNKATGLPAGPTEAATTVIAPCPDTIEMNDQLKFEPEKCTIKAGAAAIWKTVGATPHTATSAPNAPVKFDSKIVGPNEEFTFTFTAAGDVPYVCTLHEGAGMVGTIVVEAA